jgi:hypothetical protein
MAYCESCEDGMVADSLYTDRGFQDGHWHGRKEEQQLLGIGRYGAVVPRRWKLERTQQPVWKLFRLGRTRSIVPWWRKQQQQSAWQPAWIFQRWRTRCACWPVPGRRQPQQPATLWQQHPWIVGRLWRTCRHGQLVLGRRQLLEQSPIWRTARIKPEPWLWWQQSATTWI